MTRYKVSKTLDVEVNYFLTKAENALFDAEMDSNFDLIESLDKQITAYNLLMLDYVYENSGVFTVTSPHYKLACQCRDSYKAVH